MNRPDTIHKLPDLFAGPDGSRVTDSSAWPAQRQHLASLICDYQYGVLPPAPDAVDIEDLHNHRYTAYTDATHRQYRIHCGAVSFILDLILPRSTRPAPVLLTGDGCWCDLTEAVVGEALRRGYIVAYFNRLEVASDPSPDPGHGGRSSGLHAAYPQGDFGAIAAWAWGYHRAVDALQQVEEADAQKIIISGHSRGGKAVLLAGALDERIAMTAANGSGCGGAALYRWRLPDAEPLKVLAEIRPSWFCRRYADYIDQESSLPFDQHMLLALVAPRPLLITEALGDHWANPPGTWQAYSAAREAYTWLNASSHIGLRYRGGVHAHSYDDFLVTLDFADWQLRGIPSSRCFHPSPGPFSNLPKNWASAPKI